MLTGSRPENASEQRMAMASAGPHACTHTQMDRECKNIMPAAPSIGWAKVRKYTDRKSEDAITRETPRFVRHLIGNCEENTSM